MSRSLYRLILCILLSHRTLLKMQDYRLRTATPRSIIRLFAYISVWQRQTQIVLFQTHALENARRHPDPTFARSELVSDKYMPWCTVQSVALTI